MEALQSHLSAVRLAPVVTRTDSQAQQILSYLQAGNSITPRDAIQLFGCMRLAARIWDLRQDGHNIVSEDETDGLGKTWARYSLSLRPVMVCADDGQGLLFSDGCDVRQC